MGHLHRPADRGFDDVEATADWGIVSLGAGKSDLAVNATLGIAVEINADLSVKRSVDFEPSAVAAVRLASSTASSAPPVEGRSPRPMARVSSLRARAASSGSAPRTWTSSSAT